MPARHPIYRSLLRLYPRGFRTHYGDDLVQQFEDLISDRGARTAWARTCVDLIVTVPRYRLERVMNEQHSVATVNVGITLLAVGGAASLVTGLYPGMALFVAALALGVAQRGTLAQAIRTPDSNRRRRRLVTAAVLAVVFLASYFTYDAVAWQDQKWTITMTLLLVTGIPSMFGAVVFLITGLLTPRSRNSRPAAPVA